MSARPAPLVPRLRPMMLADLDAVHAIEVRAYRFPWSRGNLVDSLAAAYVCEVCELPGEGIVGYQIAMPGVDEMHLLNITVAPERQGRGLASTMLDALEARCRLHGLQTLWLEVRESNARARALYLRRGFAELGRRKGYYPAPFSRREDAIVMRLDLAGPAAEGGDAVD